MPIKLKLAHILCEHKYQVEDVLRKLQAGETFSQLAKKFSKCPSAEQGGELGLIDIRRLDEDFSEAAQLLRVGQVSPVVRTRFGYHLILRQDEREE